MKKIIISFLCLLFFSSLCLNCNRSSKNQNLNQRTIVNGNILFQGSFLSLTHDDSWIMTEDIEDQFLKLSTIIDDDTVYILIKAERDRFRTPKESADHFAVLLEGTPAVKLSYGNNDYYSTNFFLNVPQIMMITKSGEYRIIITLQGPNIEKNERVIKVLNSIEYHI